MYCGCISKHHHNHRILQLYMTMVNDIKYLYQDVQSISKLFFYLIISFTFREQDQAYIKLFSYDSRRRWDSNLCKPTCKSPTLPPCYRPRIPKISKLNLTTFIYEIISYGLHLTPQNKTHQYLKTICKASHLLVNENLPYAVASFTRVHLWERREFWDLCCVVIQMKHKPF